MGVHTAEEAKRIVTEGAEMGALNDTQARLLMTEVDADEARMEGMALEAANRHFDNARRIGSETNDELTAVAAEGAALADAIAHGRINPRDGRIALARLLTRQQAAEHRQSTFSAAAESAVTIEADPRAWGRDFLRRYPGARRDYSF